MPKNCYVLQLVYTLKNVYVYYFQSITMLKKHKPQKNLYLNFLMLVLNYDSNGRKQGIHKQEYPFSSVMT